MVYIVEKARIFATAAHHAAGNVRKYTGEPYINHPAAVVELVSSVPHIPEMLAAAWLHDTVEDAGVSLDLIETEFGGLVAGMVEMLTDVSHAHDGLREHRKRKDREHTAKASPSVKTIKLADLIDNTRSIVERDPNFAKVYLAEKRLLLEVLRGGGCKIACSRVKACGGIGLPKPGAGVTKVTPSYAAYAFRQNKNAKNPHTCG